MVDGRAGWFIKALSHSIASVTRSLGCGCVTGCAAWLCRRSDWRPSRIENSQIGVFLSYVSRFGYNLIDRQLYLPKNWAEDPERRGKARVQDDVEFRAKGKMIGPSL